LKIGVCAKDLKGNLEDNLKWLSNNDFDGFQIWQPQIEASNLSLEEFKQRTSDLGLEVSAIGAGPNLVDKKVAVESVEKCKGFMDLSVELGCHILCAETKILPKGVSLREGWQVCEDTISELCEYAEKLNVLFAIECAGPCFIRDHIYWHELKKKVNSPALKVNYDPANIAWGGADPVEACESLLKEIIHFHAKDMSYIPSLEHMNHEEDHDCVLGTGLIAYKEVLKLMTSSNYKGYYCIEMHSGEQDRRHDILASKLELEKILKEVQL